MKPHGIVCKCGTPKRENQFFCQDCWRKLPLCLRESLVSSPSWPHLRVLIREAVNILGLPQTENAKRKKFYA